MNRGLLQRNCIPPDHPHRLCHLPSLETRARPNPSHAASGFWAQRVPQRDTKEWLAQSILSPGNWQLYISFYSMQMIMMSKQSSNSKPGHNQQLLPLPRRWHSSPQHGACLLRAVTVPFHPKGLCPLCTQPGRCSRTHCHIRDGARSLQKGRAGKMSLFSEPKEMSLLEPVDPRAVAVTPLRKGNKLSTA